MPGDNIPTMVFPWVGSFSVWGAVSNFGQSELLLPFAACFGVALACRAPTRSLAVDWLGSLLAAATFVGLTKLAFMGWGVGSSAWDFTGVSGHAMSSAAVYPLLFALAFGGSSHRSQRLAMAAGFALALLIAVSRLKVHAHSPSEVLTGGLLGAGVTFWVLRGRPIPSARGPALALLALFALVLPGHNGERLGTVAEGAAPDDVLTWLALQASGHQRPYVRADLHRVGAVPAVAWSSGQTQARVSAVPARVCLVAPEARTSQFCGGAACALS